MKVEIIDDNTPRLTEPAKRTLLSISDSTVREPGKTFGRDCFASSNKYLVLRGAYIDPFQPEFWLSPDLPLLFDKLVLDRERFHVEIDGPDGSTSSQVVVFVAGQPTAKYLFALAAMIPAIFLEMGVGQLVAWTLHLRHSPLFTVAAALLALAWATRLILGARRRMNEFPDRPDLEELRQELRVLKDFADPVKRREMQRNG